MLWLVDEQKPVALHQQIAASVRRAVAQGDLKPGEPLPPAGELAVVLKVHANTVLHAYRRLREEGILEFRRGRGVRVRGDAAIRGVLAGAAREFLALGRAHGYGPSALAAMIQDIGSGQ